MEHQIENLTEHLTAIRLFVSSTFSDMHAERSCFNDTLVPRLRGLCRDRGVSFFNVDLRWGITGEDIANDKLIPLCLNEVDKCRPFFLAIIGGRYGSQMGPVSQSLLAEYPWLSEKSGASYTDLEITYHFLKNRQGANSLFLFKKCPEPEDPEEKRALQMLKEYIRAQAGERVREYGSLEEFGHIVVQEFDRWLTEMYGQVDIHLERALLVQREIDSHTVRNTAEEESIYKCAVNTTASILVHGDGPLGKTTVLNNVAKDFPDRIVVNCLSDEANVSWPYVAFSIYEKLVVLPGIALDDSGWFEEHATGFCQDALLSRAEEEQLKDAFLKLLDGIRCEKETVLVINDLEYIQGDRTRYLQWLPANTPERFHIVCSTNDGDILNSARIMGWNLIEMQPMKENIAESILVDELTKIGKNAAQARMLLRSKLAGYPGYIKNAIDFLNAFGSFDTICLLSEKLSTADSFSEFYGLILDEIEAKYGADFRLELRLALAAMSLSALPLGEAGCYYVLDAVNETPKTRWSAVSDVLSALRWSYSGGMISTTLRNYITESLTSGEKDRLHDTLGAYWLSVVGADRNGTDTRYLKAALSHYSDSKNVTAILSLLSDAETVKKLCVHNADCVRRGLFVVMFHSDRNVSKVIITRMTELIGMAKPGDDSVGIALLELVRIFKELNLTKDSKRLNQLMELAVAEQIVPMEEMEKESIYDAIDLMARQALERVDDAQVFAELDRMILSPNISPVGKAKCSVIKANLKLKTHHSEVLADTEEAIRLATKAASMSSILSAYDIQITALVWKHRYDEALELISSAEQWAQKMGYAFYLIAYAQQKIVCLYRKEEYEPALAESRRNYDLFMRWGSTDHAQVMQYNIGIILNLSKQYEECIRCVTDVLKDKKLVSKNRVQLLSVLKAAYFNSEKYEKARQTIGLALKEPDLSEETEIHLRLSLAACWLMKGQAGLSKAIPELNCSFTALQKRGNLEPIVYCLHGFFQTLSLNKEGLDFWQHWKEQIGDEEVFYHLEAEPEDEMMNGAYFTAIIDSPDVKRNMSKLMDAYKIAVERKDYMAAGDTAEKLGMQYRRAEPVKCAACYLDGAKAYQQAGVPEKMTACAVNALEALVRGGQPTDVGLYQQARQYLDGSCGKVADLWVKAAVMLSEPGYEDDPLPMLKEILSGYKDCKRLVLVCLSDLSTLIATELSTSEIEGLVDAAMAAGIPEMIVMRLINAIAGEAFAQREAVFGQKRIAEIKQKDPGFASVIAASPYFELSGGVNYKELFGDAVPVTERTQYTVQPKFKCRHLDHIWATVTRFSGDDDYSVLCITDIVFKSMPEELEAEVQDCVARYRSQAADRCELTLQPNKMVKCAALIDGNGLIGKTAAYVEHTRYLSEIIKAMDALAGRYSD